MRDQPPGNDHTSTSEMISFQDSKSNPGRYRAMSPNCPVLWRILSLDGDQFLHRFFLPVCVLVAGPPDLRDDFFDGTIAAKTRQFEFH